MTNVVIPKIKREVYWNMGDVREMCIRNNFYTRGDVDAYAEMLNFIGLNDPTDENIYKVAYDIVSHSDMSTYGQTFEEDIASVMYILQADVIKTFFHINE